MDVACCHENGIHMITGLAATPTKLPKTSKVTRAPRKIPISIVIHREKHCIYWIAPVFQGWEGQLFKVSTCYSHG
jgi:hypothetical protein